MVIQIKHIVDQSLLPKLSEAPEPVSQQVFWPSWYWFLERLHRKPALRFQRKSCPCGLAERPNNSSNTANCMASLESKKSSLLCMMCRLWAEQNRLRSANTDAEISFERLYYHGNPAFIPGSSAVQISAFRAKGEYRNHHCICNFKLSIIGSSPVSGSPLFKTNICGSPQG